LIQPPIVFIPHIFLQSNHRDTLPILENRFLYTVMPHHNMQYHSIVGWVQVMTVGLPVTGPDMYLDIPLSHSALSGDDSIPEISPLVIISSARVNDFYWLTLFAGQYTPGQQLVLPDLDYFLLRTVVYWFTPSRYLPNIPVS
jgi:hypothetical protein